MNKHTFLTVVVSAIIVTSGIVQTADGQNRSVVGEAQRITGDRFAFTARTPRGAAIYAVNRPPAALLSAIDQGLTDLFAVSRKNGYGRRLNYADYTIYIGRADRTKDSQGQYSPDIAVGAAQYAGSEYDQGGFIYAAGMVVATNPSSFVIAEHTKNFDRVSNVVRYEGEHLVLFHNDPRRYAATMDHSRGGGHPILQ
ncbi:MAG: hypothetical protein ABIV21_02645 [Pyrinomonadaceae bacterium]